MAIKQNDNGQVTFIYRPELEAKEVFLAGDFNDWDFRRMTRMRDGSFRTRVYISPGEYEYKYVVDGVLVHDPDAECQIVNPFGEMNSLALIPGRTRRRSAQRSIQAEQH